MPVQLRVTNGSVTGTFAHSRLSLSGQLVLQPYGASISVSGDLGASFIGQIDHGKNIADGTFSIIDSSPPNVSGKFSSVHLGRDLASGTFFDSDIGDAHVIAGTSVTTYLENGPVITGVLDLVTYNLSGLVAGDIPFPQGSVCKVTGFLDVGDDLTPAFNWSDIPCSSVR